MQMNALTDITPDHAWSGSRYIDVTDPQPEDMNLQEIATGLSREQRYGGSATSIFWSVAQHSLLAVHIARQDGLKDAAALRCLLMHDAPEYMLSDMIQPVKRNVPGYRPLEAIWWYAIAKRFGLPHELPEIVKHYDLLTLAVEKQALISPRAGRWPGLPNARGLTIPSTLLALTPDEARVEFLAECRRVGLERVRQVDLAPADDCAKTRAGDV